MRLPEKLRPSIAAMVLGFVAVTAHGQDKGAELRTLPGPSLSIAFTPDSKLLVSGGMHGEVKVWDIATGLAVHTIPGKDRVESVAISPDGKQVAFVAEGTITLFDIATAKPVRTWKGHHPVLFSRDGTLLIFGDKGSSGTIKVWDLSQDKKRDLTGHFNPIACLALSPNGQLLASGGCDNKARIWNLASGAAMHVFSASGMAGLLLYVGSVAFSADGRTLAYSEAIMEPDPKGRPGSFMFKSGRIVLRDVETGAEIRKFDAHSQPIWAAAFSPDGRTLVTTGGKTLKAWDVSSSALRREFAYNANALAFSPDGSSLACATDTGVRFIPSADLK